MIPWVNGKLLVWDTTSPDTFAASIYVWRATSEAGAVAALAEDRKRTNLEPSYTFTPIAIEISGNFSKFLKDLGNRLRQATGDKNFYTYLIQRHSVSAERKRSISAGKNWTLTLFYRLLIFVHNFKLFIYSYYIIPACCLCKLKPNKLYTFLRLWAEKSEIIFKPNYPYVAILKGHKMVPREQPDVTSRIKLHPCIF